MKEIKTVAIAGAGTMGSGIAIVAARAGFTTYLFDKNEENLQRARKQTEGFFAKSVAKGKLSEEQVSEILGRMRGTMNMDDLGNCDLVIEAAVEKAEIKKAIFENLEQIVAPLGDRRVCVDANRDVKGGWRVDCSGSSFKAETHRRGKEPELDGRHGHRHVDGEVLGGDPALGDGDIVGGAVAIDQPGAIFGRVGDAVFELPDPRHLAVDIAEPLVARVAPKLPVFQ